MLTTIVHGHTSTNGEDTCPDPHPAGHSIPGRRFFLRTKVRLSAEPPPCRRFQVKKLPYLGLSSTRRGPEAVQPTSREHSRGCGCGPLVSGPIEA
ncbi:hypothetical protein PGTUg99_018476 [Puccinia graminis f. sp. tritici]|uniref:Uncharacterized protein n=1 Tax=Puccinia graminis f. sp. tritici TaxID=56615 RepID=A0A5B0PF39_PUCGR|nr:hypothetical protein PGTUg99_018476 [Puccinia graminis f. sp. tritici]